MNFNSEASQQNFFSSSINIDKRLFKEIIFTNMLHARFLLHKDIINNSDYEKIYLGLKEILKRLENGVIKFDPSSKNIQTFIKDTLNYYIGDVSKNLDIEKNAEGEFNLTLKLYVEKQISNIINSLCSIKEILSSKAINNTGIYSTNFTSDHNTTFSTYLSDYCKLLTRDISRFQDCNKRISEISIDNCNSINLLLEKNFVSDEINLELEYSNEINSLLDIDYIIELSSSLSILMMHISKLSKELLFSKSTNTNKVEFFIPTFFYKENIQIENFIHTKNFRVNGNLIKLLSTINLTDLNSNVYVTENLENILDAMDNSLLCIELLKQILPSLDS